MEPVSVVITCFNLERFIAEAIRSVLDQDFEGAVEIIVVDDCSTDESAAIIKQFAGVRYVGTQRNGGVLLATLAGMESASYDIVAFLDGDDIWERGKLRAVVTAFEAAAATALVSHDLSYADAGGVPLDRITRPFEVLTRADPARRPEVLRDGILGHGDYFWLGSALSIRRSVARAEEFASWARALPDPANTYQDWPLAFWVAALPGARLDYVPEKLFRYRLHQSNYSGDAATPAKAIRNFTRARNTVEAMRAIAEKRGLQSSIARALRTRTRFYDYLIDLYSGRRGAAVSGWLRSLRYVREHRILAKEMARFLGIQALGPARFSRFASRRRGSPG